MLHCNMNTEMPSPLRLDLEDVAGRGDPQEVRRREGDPHPGVRLQAVRLSEPHRFSAFPDIWEVNAMTSDRFCPSLE